MTAIEKLQKYGLATDVQSIKERVSNDFQHFGIAVEYLRNDESLSKMAFDRKVNILEDELRTADLALLCELADRTELLTTTIRECIALLAVSGENTKAIVAEKLKGLVE